MATLWPQNETDTKNSYLPQQNIRGGTPQELVGTAGPEMELRTAGAQGGQV